MVLQTKEDKDVKHFKKTYKLAPCGPYSEEKDAILIDFTFFLEKKIYERHHCPPGEQSGTLSDPVK